MTPNALRPNAGSFSGKSGQAELRSSISASQLGMAEGLFSYQVGSAQLTRTDLTTNNWLYEVGISGFTRPTKHTLRGFGRWSRFGLALPISKLKIGRQSSQLMSGGPQWLLPKAKSQGNHLSNHACELDYLERAQYEGFQ
jgi:hypothetical protein